MISLFKTAMLYTPELLLVEQKKILPVKSFANLGDMTEGWLGASLVARFLWPEREITPTDVFSVVQRLNLNKDTSKAKTVLKKKSFKRVGNPKVKGSQPDVINFAVGLSTISFDGFANYSLFEKNTAIIQSAIGFASSPQIMQYVTKVYNDPKQNIIDISSVGTEDQKGTKVDLKIAIDGKPISWGLISLKAGGTKQLGQVGMAWASSEEKRASRGVFDLFNGLFGVSINENLKKYYVEALQSGNYKKIVENIEYIYRDAYDKMATRFDGGQNELLSFLQTFARGIRYEAVLEEEGVILVHLSAGEFKVLNFNQLLDFVTNKEIDVEVEYQPSGLGAVPKISIAMTVDGVNYGKLVSIRPKIRIDETTKKIKEFRHYVEKEPGLVKLLSTS